MEVMTFSTKKSQKSLVEIINYVQNLRAQREEEDLQDKEYEDFVQSLESKFSFKYLDDSMKRTQNYRFRELQNLMNELKEIDSRNIGQESLKANKAGSALKLRSKFMSKLRVMQHNLAQ